MDALMHKLRDVSPLNGKIRLKVGIVRVWKPYTFDGDVKVISSFEMVLVDEEGCSIQASVPEELIHLFRFKLFTSCVYIISSFKVIQNLGSYRVTNHKYRLVFMAETSVHVVVGC